MLDNNPTAVIVLMVFGAFLLLMVIAVLPKPRSGRENASRRRRGSFTSYLTSSYKPSQELSGFPYELQQNFLTPSELSFYRVLQRVVGNRAVLCPKVRLGDLFWVNVADKSQNIGYANKINRKHVDFLICDPETMRPLFAIELDDSSHQRDDRQDRDTFVDGAFAAARLPLIHIPVQRSYAATEINAQLTPYFTPAATDSSAPAAAIPPSDTAPICPRCGGKLIVRTVKNGPNAGAKFWGCSNYPNCRHMARYSEANPTAF